MKTSYFARVDSIDNPLSISGKSPDWYLGPEFKTLAPKWSFFNDYKKGNIGEAEYTEQYKELVLAELDAKQIYDSIITQFGDGVVLLCYEKPGDFCHRRIVARWFEDELGVIVPERQTKEEQKQDDQNKVVDSLVDF